MNSPLNTGPDELRQLLEELDRDSVDELTNLAKQALASKRNVSERHAQRSRDRGEHNVALWYSVNGPEAGNELIVPPEEDLERFATAILKGQGVRKPEEAPEDATLLVESWRYDRMVEQWKVGDRIVCTSRQSTYPDPKDLRFGEVVAVEPVVTVDIAGSDIDKPKIRITGKLLVRLDGESTRSINSDVIRHVRDSDPDPLR